MVQLVVKIDCVTLPPPPERILEGKEKERTNAHETSEEESEREREKERVSKRAIVVCAYVRVCAVHSAMFISSSRSDRAPAVRMLERAKQVQNAYRVANSNKPRRVRKLLGHTNTQHGEQAERQHSGQQCVCVCRKLVVKLNWTLCVFFSFWVQAVASGQQTWQLVPAEREKVRRYGRARFRVCLLTYATERHTHTYALATHPLAPVVRCAISSDKCVPRGDKMCIHTNTGVCAGTA